MTGDQTASFIYLALLGTVIAAGLFLRGRDELGKTLQNLGIWVLIFLGVIAAYGLWGDIRREVAPTQALLSDGRIEVPRSPDGHYHLRLDVNGVSLPFIVDTGASDIVLSARDAEAAGIDTDGLAYLGQAMTANGLVRTAPVRLDEVRLGPLVDRDLRAVVNEGEMDRSLLGMGYLELFDRIEIEGNRLVLTR